MSVFLLSAHSFLQALYFCQVFSFHASADYFSKRIQNLTVAKAAFDELSVVQLDKIINDKETTEDILIIARSYKGILVVKKVSS